MGATLIKHCRQQYKLKTFIFFIFLFIFFVNLIKLQARCWWYELKLVELFFVRHAKVLKLPKSGNNLIMKKIFFLTSFDFMRKRKWPPECESNFECFFLTLFIHFLFLFMRFQSFYPIKNSIKAFENLKFLILGFVNGLQRNNKKIFNGIVREKLKIY